MIPNTFQFSWGHFLFFLPSLKSLIFLLYNNHKRTTYSIWNTRFRKVKIGFIIFNQLRSGKNYGEKKSLLNDYFVYSPSFFLICFLCMPNQHNIFTLQSSFFIFIWFHIYSTFSLIIMWLREHPISSELSFLLWDNLL